MPYGTIKVDNITFTNAGSDQTITVSGLFSSTSGNLTVTGTVSGNTIQGQTISGVTVTGTTANFTSGNFTNISGGTHTITSGVFAAGSAAAPSISFVSDPNTGIYSPGADQVAISTSGTGRLFVNSNGDINIGHNSSIYSSAGRGLISVNGSSSSIIDLQTGTTSRFRMFCNGTDVELVNSEATGVLKFGTNNTEAMRLDSSGRLGIGTSSPGTTLEISSGGGTSPSLTGTSGNLAITQPGLVTSLQIGGYGTAPYALWLQGQNKSGSAFPIVLNPLGGSVGIGTTSPSQLLTINGNDFVGSSFNGLSVGDTSAERIRIGYKNGSPDTGLVPAQIITDVSTLSIASRDGGEIRFHTGSGVPERARIDSSGRLGLGTSSPGSKLEIAGTSGSAALGLVETGVRSWAIRAGGATTNKLDIADLSAGQTRLTIDSSGNVGIGTTSPGASYLLDVAGAAKFSGGNGYVSFGDNGFIRTDATNELRFQGGTSGISFWKSGLSSESVRIDNSGQVGIGTSSPGYAFDCVAGTAAVVAARFRGNSSANNNTQIRFYGANAATDQWAIGNAIATDDATRNFDIFDVVSSANRLRIDSSGRVGIGTTSPSALLSVNATTTSYVATAFNVGEPSTATGRMLYMGYNTADTVGFIQSVHWGNEFKPLALNPNGGNVGIGTTAPIAALHVSGPTNAAYFLYKGGNDATGFGAFQNGAGNTIAYLGNGGGAALTGGTSSDFVVRAQSNLLLAVGGDIERARIDSSGRLLVGTSSSRQVNASIAALQLQIEGTTYNSSSMSLVTNQNVADGSYIVLGKSRGTSLNSSTIVNSGDSLGSFWFCGADGTDLKRGAVIEAFVDGTPGANDMPGRLVFSTTADGASSSTERMRIGSNGFLKVSPNGTYLDATGDYHELYTYGSSPYLLWATHAGSSPNGITINYSTATPPNNTSNEFFRCFDTNGAVLRASIRSDGGLANYQANNANLSDYNAKTDISAATSTWSCIKDWEIVNYRYKDQLENASLNIGIIAQQVAESCPEVITIFQEAKDATEDAPAQEERLGVKEQQMYWMAIKALQEAMARIETLEAKVAALEAS